MKDSTPPSAAYALGRILRVVGNAVRDLVGMGGCGLISYGVWEIYKPAGLIVAGILMAAVCLLLARAGG